MRLNVVMKKVTSWAAIILIPTLIAGIYGMNFRHMPELSWQVGYPVALGMMVVAAGILFWVFRRRDWL
jgi:magnesium transporter